MWELVGNHHPFPPEPIIAENTRYVDAGCIKIGVEHRRLDGLAGRLQATLEGTPFEEVYREWIAAQIAQSDGGLKQPPPSRGNSDHAAGAMAASGTDASLHVVEPAQLPRGRIIPSFTHVPVESEWEPSTVGLVSACTHLPLPGPPIFFACLTFCQNPLGFRLGGRGPIAGHSVDFRSDFRHPKSQMCIKNLAC